MKPIIIVAAIALLAIVLCQNGAAEPTGALLPPVVSEDEQLGGKDQLQPPDKKKQPDQKPIAPPPETDLFTRTPAPLSDSLGFNPSMLGDLGVLFARQNVTVTGTRTTTTTTHSFINDGDFGRIPVTKTVTTTVPFSLTRTILVPIAASSGSFKIAENESPRPVDRVYCTYNYFGGIQSPDHGAFGPGNTSQTTTAAPAPGTSSATTVNTNFRPPRFNADLNREVFGFEKTFLDGYASVEMRLPLLQLSSDVQGFGSQQVGDLTIIAKYALLLDNVTGNVFSVGMDITAPTGSPIDTIDGSLHSTLIQPWFGYIVNFDQFFVQAFHSVVVPTDARDVTLLFNDVGVNYWLYRGSPDRFLSFVAPVAEIHVTTPLNHRSGDSLVFIPDTVALTVGVHLGIFRNTILSLGVATPVTGPRPNNIEAILNLNRRF